MFHHLPKKVREEFCREAFRVLKPGGRVLIVDFAKPPRQKSTFRFHRHGQIDLDRVAADLGQRGFNIVERGDVGTKGLRYLIGQPALRPPKRDRYAKLRWRKMRFESRHATKGGVMSLKEKLEAIRAASASLRPPEQRALMQRATDGLRALS
jgi:SAM-dependent methyltransferase